LCFARTTMQVLAGRPARAVPGQINWAVPVGPQRSKPRSCSTIRNANAVFTPRGRGVWCEAHARHPPAAGLVKDTQEKDACGVGFVGELTKKPSRKCITDAIGMLVRMSHRGACGCEENTGMMMIWCQIASPVQASKTSA
jgi:hypothetical protein